MVDLGVKRTCVSCGARFYDMKKKIVVCPKCHFEQTAEAFVKQKASSYKQAPKPEHDEDDLQAILSETDGIELESGKGEQDMDVLEDASDLGNDDQDIAEVFDNIDKLDLTTE